MNKIYKKPVEKLGFDFIPKEFLTIENEFYFRNTEINSDDYRNISEEEKALLISNLNFVDDWNNLFVKEGFDPRLIRNSKFYGINRIGKIDPIYLEFKNLRLEAGIYHSTIISSDLGDNIAIHQVNILSHYQIGDEVILFKIDELSTTNTAKFGNGLVKEGEKEEIRIWIELANENGGRKVIPFDGMEVGDAYLWSQNREDKIFQEALKRITLNRFSKQRGHYGKIGSRSVIKSSKMIKDCHIGTDAYIKGINKLKNLTIHSNEVSNTQIGEGCELVNGIIEEGCRIFYGVKAVRFILGAHSQLKYGARLINSYLACNSTISCCEVLNSLLFPFHEQHHNNSFLCASIVKGQSNMAAGATLGSNHNSRGADGELYAGRGFWPGLSVSLKHNSKFASFNLISKGNYPAEIQNPLPFSLIGNEGSGNTIIVPGYWFEYNFYALARNSYKFKARDKRKNKSIQFEYDFMAPDTVYEIINAIELLEKWMGNLKNPDFIEVKGIEGSNRTTIIRKPARAIEWYKDLIIFHFARTLVNYAEEKKIQSVEHLIDTIKQNATPIRSWENLGGILIPNSSYLNLIENIKSGEYDSWDKIHEFYQKENNKYSEYLLENALNAIEKLGWKDLKFLFNKALEINQKIYQNIIRSREKDYQDEFRKNMFTNQEEMNAVIGSLSENDFINWQKSETEKLEIKLRTTSDELQTTN